MNARTARQRFRRIYLRLRREHALLAVAALHFPRAHTSELHQRADGGTYEKHGNEQRLVLVWKGDKWLAADLLKGARADSVRPASHEDMPRDLVSSLADPTPLLAAAWSEGTEERAAGDVQALAPWLSDEAEPPRRPYRSSTSSETLRRAQELFAGELGSMPPGMLRTIANAEEDVLLGRPHAGGSLVQLSTANEVARRLRQLGVIWNDPAAAIASRQAKPTPEPSLHERWFESVLQEDIDGMQSALDEGVDVDARAEEGVVPTVSGGETALTLAARSASGHVVQFLLARGACSAPSPSPWKSPLGWAAETGNTLICRALLAAGVDPKLDERPLDLLREAYNSNNLEVVALLVDAGVLVDTRDDLRQRVMDRFSAEGDEARASRVASL